MQIHVTTGDGVPIYRQIVRQISLLVASGKLKPGAELPAIRVLAEQLVINPNTVARAYKELEYAGVVASKMGSGTVVADKGSPLNRRERERLLNERVDALLGEARQLKFSTDDVIDAIRQRAGAVAPPPANRDKEDDDGSGD